MKRTLLLCVVALGSIACGGTKFEAKTSTVQAARRADGCADAGRACRGTETLAGREDDGKTSR